MINEKLNERSRQILDEIKRRTSTTAYQLEFDTESAPTIFDSKVGGLPYWDPAKTYPTDSNGKKMFLLAQINFDQDKAESPLPQSGMLQFFVGDDDLYGLDYDPTKQKDWRIVYHEKIDTSVTTEAVEAMGIHVPLDNEEVYSPVLKSCVFHLVKKETWITSMHSDAFDTLTLELAEELFGETEADYGSDVFGDEQFTLIEEEDSHNKNSQLLGHPYFTQEDVREEGSRYDTLLFQLDSETVDKEKITMWGDCGVGNFFINAEDLQRLDFSNVLYNWDCC
nr:MAG TPA: protein of unknown function (DUF1963) [Caudoviricetes sp.]